MEVRMFLTSAGTMNPLIVKGFRLDECVLRKERVASQELAMTAADIEKNQRFKSQRLSKVN